MNLNNFYVDDYKRVWGNASINGEIDIILGANDILNVFTDTESYTITLPPRKYTTEYTTNVSDLVEEINRQISLSPLPIEALLGGFHKDQKYNVVVLRMTNGKDIADLSGSFFDNYFA